MTRLQFRVLFREFVFRMVDLEVLSTHAQGDLSRLFGQFAALLIFLSILFSFAALGVGGGDLLPRARLLVAWSGEHFLIATTMLVVGLFAVLSWGSTYPDRRDVLVLAPLPIRARTIFLAKVAGVGASLGLTVLVLHAATGLVWPVALTSVPAQTVPALTTDPAMAPIDADDLESVLNRDLAPALTNGSLAPGSGGGVAIGVSKNGVRRIITYGTAKTDSIFEIGSLTKTFTALALAQMAVKGRVTLDERMRELLPGGVVPKPVGSEITLVDLATHHSGLPANPGNLKRSGKPNPGADYRAADLYAFLAKHGVARPAYPSFSYSNAGFGLLGVALANRFGGTYSQLLEHAITGPLGMKDTVLSLSPEQQGRMIQGYDAKGRPVDPWDLDALAGAGAIRSTAGDLLTYLEVHLHPERFGTAQSGLPEAVGLTRQVQATVAPGLHITLAWIFDTARGVYWHNGAISGYSSHAFFHPGRDFAAVVMVNQAPGPIPFSELLAQHVRQRLEGEPAVSFANVSVPESRGVVGLLRVFAVYWAVMIASGVFLFCCVLGVQGFAALLLPRRVFLRVSSWLQMAAFCLFVSVYFLQPAVPSPDVLIAAQGQGWVAWSPTYWFLGLFQYWSGSPALAALAYRALAGLAIAVGATAAAYALSYFRVLRKIVEEPDITPSWRGGNPLPGFGSALATALMHFSVRTLLRSRQHRILLAFYLGIAFALTIFLLRHPAAQRQLFEVPVSGDLTQVSAPALAASLVILGFWVVGTRVVFSMPADLKANWIFRVTPVPGGPRLLNARRRALLALSVIPVWAGSAVLFFWMWPWRPAASHLAVLGLLGALMAELCLWGAQKIPFTCSYLPGRSNFHMTFWLCIGLLMQGLNKAAEFEQRTLENPAAFAVLLLVLVAGLAAARWRNGRESESAEGGVRFEEAPHWDIQALGLSQDVAPPLSASVRRPASRWE